MKNNIKTRITVTAALLLVLCGELCSQSFSASDHFAVKPADYRYLWYGSYHNTFDSARIECTFGEVRLRNGGSSTRIPIRVSEQQWKSDNAPICVAGDSARGRTSSLVDFIRTERFAVPSGGGAVSYFRMVAAFSSVDCDTEPTTDENNTPSDWREAMLAVPRGSWILDTTSFVVELVNETDATVTTLDSVMVWGEPGSMLLKHGGSSLRRVEHDRTLPASCHNDSVYLRLVAYRWGPTPLGVTGQILRNMFTMSTSYRDTAVPYTSTPRWANPAFADTVYREYANRILEYWREDTARPCLPVIFGFNGLPPSVDSIFRDSVASMGRSLDAAFCDCIESWITDSLGMYATLYPPVSPKMSPRSGSLSSDPGRAWMTISESDTQLAIEVVGRVTPITIEMYDIRGSRLGLLWTGLAPASVRVEKKDLASGLAVVIMKAPE